MTKTEKLKMCPDCNDDFYNGNNKMGIKECWGLDSAKLVKRQKIPVNQTPPFTQAPIPVLNCFSQQGYVFWEA